MNTFITGTAKHQSSKLCYCCAVVFRAMALVPVAIAGTSAIVQLATGVADIFGKVCIFLHRPTSVNFWENLTWEYEVMQIWKLGGCENFVGKWKELVFNALGYFLPVCIPLDESDFTGSKGFDNSTSKISWISQGKVATSDRWDGQVFNVIM